MSTTARDWSAFDRPELTAAIGARSADGVDALIALDGMHCAGCAARAERLLAGKVERPQVNIGARTVSFRWRPASIAISSILQLLDEAGLQPRVLAQEQDLLLEQLARRKVFLRLGIAAICAMQVMMLAWPSYSNAAVEPDIQRILRWAQLIIASPGVLWAGWPFFTGAFAALRSRTANMDVPVALALAAAYGVSTLRTLLGSGDLYFDTATMFVSLLLTGRFLEQRTRAIAGDRLRLLAGRRALTALRRKGGSGITESVPIGVLATGDIVVVPPGETLPADGCLIESGALTDESLLTGESRPVSHKIGDTVVAGSINMSETALCLRVTRIGTDTTLAQITRLLDNGVARSSTAQRWADRIAAGFVLIIIVLAALTFAWNLHHGIDLALATAMAVLVASCPCALSLATPIVVAAGTSKLAANGVLTANPDALLSLTEIDTVVFDKTGTLTVPEMMLLHTRLQGGLDESRCIANAAALERESRHPIAKAFQALSSELTAAEVRHIPGVGVEGQIAGRSYRLGVAGNDGLADARVTTGTTVVELATEAGVLARFELGARLRADATTTINALRQRGLKLIILSGDDEAATSSLAGQLRVDEYASRQTPAGKLAYLHKLQARGCRVLAVGDGINDAPLLAAADLSAAMPNGSAITQSKADLVLVGDALGGLMNSLDIADCVKQRVRENLLWALIYNLAVIPLAATGALAPWMAAAGMSMSSLLVAANALRLGHHLQVDARDPSSRLAEAS
jgi:Cu2+-exporting ATPase